MILLDQLTKDYRGRHGRRIRALAGVSLQVPPGTALGLVGPNGAGKSTLIRLLLGYLRPSAGELNIGGLAPREYVERFGIGYVPEDVAIPPRWTVRGALEAYAALGRLPDAPAQVDAALARLGLGELTDQRVGALSKGNRQRLALAQALMGERRLLLLDEPLNGLDPLWIARLRALLAEWRAADPQRVLLVVSHNLAELERSVERAVVLLDGRLHATLDVGADAGPLEPRVLRLLGAQGEAAA